MYSVDAARKNIRKLAVKKGSIKEFSESLRITPSAIEGILNGISNPRIDTVLKIANGMGVSIDWMFTE